MIFFTKEIWEPTFGMWTIVHTLFGVVSALVLILLTNFSLAQGLLLTGSIATIWEVIESTFDSQETFYNRISDVAVALIGFSIVYLIFNHKDLSNQAALNSLIIFGAIFLLGSFLGWLTYAKYS